MEPYARALLRFVHAAVAGRQKVEAFALGTRLTRLTRELSSRDPDDALRHASDAGASTTAAAPASATVSRLFNDEWGQRGMARGRDRRDPVRRMGPRRSRRARRADGAPAPRRPQGGLGQPAQGHTRLRAARARDGGRAPVRRRLRRRSLARRDGAPGQSRRRHDGTAARHHPSPGRVRRVRHVAWSRSPSGTARSTRPCGGQRWCRATRSV